MSFSPSLGDIFLNERKLQDGILEIFELGCSLERNKDPQDDKSENERLQQLLQERLSRNERIPPFWGPLFLLRMNRIQNHTQRTAPLHQRSTRRQQRENHPQGTTSSHSIPAGN